MLEIAKHWEDRFEPKSQHHKKNRIVWATQFTNLLQLSNQEKKLKPEAAIVYKNPPTLATKLTNYKKLSQILPNTDNRGSYPCGKCALCGNFKNYKLQWLKLELDRYIGQPIYIGRYQYQADISYRLSTTDKYRLTIACFIRATVQSTNYF